VGDGVTALTANAMPVFIERHKLDGSLVGLAMPMPTALSGANQPFTVTGLTSTEGTLSRSTDGHFLSLAGYAASPGTVDPVGTTPARRVVGRISATGVIDTSTLLTTNAFVTQDIRTATSVDGTAFWVGGQGDLNGGGVLSSGIWYVPFGIPGGTQLNTTPARFLGIFGGQLFGTADTSVQVEVYKVGSGLPTSGSPSITDLPGMPATGTSPWGFVIFDLSPSTGDPTVGGLDTLYVANITGTRGIQKWTYDNGTSKWVLNKIMNTSPAMSFRGLTGLVTGSSITLVASTMGMTPNRVAVFVDDGSPTITGSTILTGTTSLVYRGVALPPYK
jgi:hypothetical protein